FVCVPCRRGVSCSLPEKRKQRADIIMNQIVWSDRQMNRLPIFSVCCMFLVIFAGCSREKPGGAGQSAARDVVNVTTVLSTIADDEKPPQVFPGHEGASGAPNQAAFFDAVFSESGRGVAYTVEKNKKFYVVHNNTRGKQYASVGNVVLSSDGRRIAYGALVEGKWCMVVDGREGRPYDTVLTPLFSPNGQHVAYQAKEGEKWYIVVDDRPNAGTIASYTAPEFSSDSALIAYVEAAASNSEMKLIVSDLTFSKQSVKWSIGDLLFITNPEKTRIAAAHVVDSKLRIIDFSFSKPDVVREGPLYDVIEQLTFSDVGSSLSYCALRGRKRLIVLDDREEPFPEGRLQELPVVRPDKKGVGVLLTSHDRFFLHQAFLNSNEKSKEYDEAANLTYSRDGRYAYAARKGQHWFVVVNGKEGPQFDRTVKPVFSADGKYLVYRARKDGKRFVVVADANGTTISQHPAYEQVFQPVFTADGTSVAYGVKDGNNLVWKVEKL
ncbi:MAG: TolB family protein, partial [Chloroflexota bacterium]